MTPILFEKTETKFDTNGLGRLSDAISCKVPEERNGMYELEMEYPIDGVLFSEIKYGRYIYAVPSFGADPQAFEIYKITKPIDGIITVNAQHISYQLSLIPAMPFAATSCSDAFVQMKKSAVESCPFSFETDKVVSANMNVKVPTSMRSLLAGQEGSILDVYGTGEYLFDMYKVKLLLHRGETKNVTIRYGKNLTDLRQEESIENTITGIVPYWLGTEEGSDIQKVVTLDQKVVQSEYADKFPYHRTVPVDFSSSFQTPPTQDQLLAKAKSYIENNDIGVPKVNLEVSFVNLADTDEYRGLVDEDIRLCDTVKVYYEKLGISATAKVIQTTWDVLADRYESIQLGDARSTLSSTLAERTQNLQDQISQSRSEASIQVEKAKTAASDMIKDMKNLTGHAFIHYNESGNPYEFIVADNADLSKAVKVWRWNESGLAYSSTGYNGDYGAVAINAKGEIVADRILAGTLTANLIKAGILSDKAGKNSWDLVTGVFSSIGTITNYYYNSSIGKYVFTRITRGAVQIGTSSDAKGTEASVIGSVTINKYYQNNVGYNSFGISSKNPVFISSDSTVGIVGGGQLYDGGSVVSTGFVEFKSDGLYGYLHDEDGYTGVLKLGDGSIEVRNGIIVQSLDTYGGSGSWSGGGDDGGGEIIVEG